MTDFMSVEEAVRYFGLGNLPPQEAIDKLEEILIENEVDVETDNAGNLISIDPSTSREALFEEHKKKTGYRPDSTVKMAEEIAKKAAKEREEATRITHSKERLREKRNGGGI